MSSALTYLCTHHLNLWKAFQDMLNLELNIFFIIISILCQVEFKFGSLNFLKTCRNTYHSSIYSWHWSRSWWESCRVWHTVGMILNPVYCPSSISLWRDISLLPMLNPWHCWICAESKQLMRFSSLSLTEAINTHS